MINANKLIENLDEIKRLIEIHLKNLEDENEEIEASIVDKFMAFKSDFIGRLGVDDFEVHVDESKLKVFIECYSFYLGVHIGSGFRQLDNFRQLVFEAQIPLDKVNDVNTLSDIKEYAVYVEDGLFQSCSTKDANELLEKYKDTECQEIIFTYRGGCILMRGTYYPEGNIVFPQREFRYRDEVIKIDDIDIKRIIS